MCTSRINFLKVCIMILMTFAVHINAKSEVDSNIEKAIEFIKIACVEGGKKVTIKGNIKGGITLKKWMNSGLESSFSIKKEEISGLVNSLSGIANENARDIRNCMKPFIPLIINALIPSENSTNGVSAAQASSSSATSSGATSKSSCAAYAGPEGASSTCANANGKGITTGVNNR